MYLTDEKSAQFISDNDIYECMKYGRDFEQAVQTYFQSVTTNRLLSVPPLECETDYRNLAEVGKVPNFIT